MIKILIGVSNLASLSRIQITNPNTNWPAEIYLFWDDEMINENGNARPWLVIESTTISAAVEHTKRLLYFDWSLWSVIKLALEW